MDDYNYIKLTYLFDIYGNLLTENQQKILDLYLNEDYSQSEISKLEGISRQAVYELIKRCYSILGDYDNKLGFYQNYLDNKQKVELIVQKLSNINDDKTKIELLDLLNELKENL